MRTALIGHTGFVGSNLATAYDFTDRYNTGNIERIRGRSYDLAVSAAARADSHRINQDGAADLAEIEEYVAILSTVDTPQLVVISTVCIYPGGTSPDETTPLRSLPSASGSTSPTRSWRAPSPRTLRCTPATCGRSTPTFTTGHRLSVG